VWDRAGHDPKLQAPDVVAWLSKRRFLPAFRSTPALIRFNELSGPRLPVRLVGCAAAIIIVSNTIRRLTRLTSPLIPFIISLVVGFVGLSELVSAFLHRHGRTGNCSNRRAGPTAWTCHSTIGDTGSFLLIVVAGMMLHCVVLSVACGRAAQSGVYRRQPGRRLVNVARRTTLPR
jgi:hypothetical protein